jgi:dolichol-phosphate mannosyltransferase
MKTKVVYVIAVHNEAAHLEKTLEILNGALTHYPIRAVILAENGSSDESLNACQKIKASWYPFPVEVLSLPKGDLGEALHAGLSLALDKFSDEDTWALLTAADLPFSLTDIEAFLKRNAESEFGLAIGSKAHAESVVPNRGRRALFSSVFYILRRVILNFDIKDTQGTVFIRIKYLPRVLPKTSSRGFFYTTDLIWQSHQEGLRIVELPVTLNPELRQSKVRAFRTGARMLGSLIQLRLKR